MSHELILVVEDDPDIRELLHDSLRCEGYRVLTASSAEEASKALQSTMPDMMLLDIMLPGEDGITFCRNLRSSREYGRLPVIVVSARLENAKIVSTLEIGADDYITKPFDLGVLAARIRAVLRRCAGRKGREEAANSVARGSVSVDIDRAQVLAGGKPVAMTCKEMLLLLTLMRRPGIVFSREALITALNGEESPVTERAIDVMVMCVRRKLGAFGNLVETVRGLGYRWSAGS